MQLAAHAPVDAIHSKDSMKSRKDQEVTREALENLETKKKDHFQYLQKLSRKYF